MARIEGTLISSPGPVLERKRKGEHGTEYVKKKSKSGLRSSDGAEGIQADILRLENGIVESRKNYNNVVVLLEHARAEAPSDGRDVLASIALCRTYCRLMVLGDLTNNTTASGAEGTIVQWLKERLKEFEEILLQLFNSTDSTKQITALNLSMRLVKEKAVHKLSSEDVTWRRGLFNDVVQMLLMSADILPVIDVFVHEYVNCFDDVRYHTFACIADIKPDQNPRMANALQILSAIENISEQSVETGAFYLNPPSKKKHELYSIAAHKKQAQRGWMSVLRSDIDDSHRKQILDLMAHRIAPWFARVEMLMDFLTDSFNLGGSTSLMALSGLFFLVKQKNLDYPHFYQKLYSLLDAKILHSKYRSRFFRLLDTFLASTHLPAALVASFIKKLSRLCLHAPPSGIVLVVPWVYNLLRSHPSCTFMIQRTTELQDRQREGWGDPFIMDEPDPMYTDAIESSLWEIHTLQSHYHPNVAAIAKIISEQFTKQAYNIEDFLDHSYATMLDAELSKDIRRPPEVEYEIPKKVFTLSAIA